jgi:probable rRNA maturation factor
MDPDEDSNSGGRVRRRAGRKSQRGFVLEIASETGDWSGFGPTQPLIEAAAAALAALPDLPDAAGEACILLTSDAEVRKLNAQWRGQDKPTNVLSFPAPAPPSVRGSGAPRFLGDIVLAAETLTREARDQDIPPVHHLQHLIVHGLLHLLGYDHETVPQAETMEALEVAALARLGIPSPYEGSELVTDTPDEDAH